MSVPKVHDSSTFAGPSIKLYRFTYSLSTSEVGKRRKLEEKISPKM